MNTTPFTLGVCGSYLSWTASQFDRNFTFLSSCICPCSPLDIS